MTILQKGNTGAAKLTLASVAEIRRLYGEGYTQGSIAKYAGVTIGTIGRIVRGETWCEGAGDRMPTELEMKAGEQRARALMLQIEREKAFEVETRKDEQQWQDRRGPETSLFSGHASPPVLAAPTHQALQEQMLSPEAKARRDAYLGTDEEPKRASPPPSPLDGGDAPAEAHGEGLARLEDVAVAEGLDVEVALRRSST